MAEPLVDDIDELAERLSSDLSRGVQQFVLSGNTGRESWNILMNRVLYSSLVEYLFEDFNEALEERGLLPLSRERVVTLVRAALLDTEDLRLRLLSAPGSVEGDVVTAAGRFSLGALTGRVHQLGIVKSLIRLLQGQAAELSGESGTGYTGRKRWRTSVSSSRHSHLNFVEADANGRWFVAPGAYWRGPREDIQFAPQASGCRCYVEYLYIVDGREEWL